MKVTLALLIFGVSIALIHANCFRNEDECDETECCLKIGPLYKCKPKLDEGATCGTHELKHILKKHVYLMKCPCAENMKCVKNEGVMGMVTGKCEVDDSGVTEPAGDE